MTCQSLKKQQRFFGMVSGKGKWKIPRLRLPKLLPPPCSSVKKFARTKHKGLPEKKVTKESFNEDYVKELEDGLVKIGLPYL